MHAAPQTVLLYGYGNPGRVDDGLGPAFAEALEARGFLGIDIDSNYQLCIEDADAVARHDVVVFADADTSGPEPFWIERIEPKAEGSFSTHSVHPAAVMAMARDILGGRTEGFLLGIRGYEFNEFAERLSDKAKQNLEAALAFFEDAVRSGALVERLRSHAKVRAPGSAQSQQG